MLIFLLAQTNVAPSTGKLWVLHRVRPCKCFHTQANTLISLRPMIDKVGVSNQFAPLTLGSNKFCSEQKTQCKFHACNIVLTSSCSGNINWVIGF